MLLELEYGRENPFRSAQQRMKMSGAVTFCLILFLLCENSFASFGFEENKDRILLRDIQVLTLHHGQMTTARRSHSVPQLKCVGGTAGCTTFIPQVAQCYNRGSDGYDVQWECKTDMDNAYRLGRVEVSCEGYEYPDDPYVLRGSCGVEYTLDLTKEGYQKQHSHDHSYYGDQHSYHQSKSGYGKKSASWGGDLITLAIVGIIIYAIYKTCLSTSHQDPDSQRGDRWGSERRSQPPPPGFRQDYMPRGDDCSSTRGSQTNTGGGGGFWTGAATGSILGYLLGGRNNTYYGYPGSHTHYTPYVGRRQGWGSGWGSAGGWGSSGLGGWGTTTRTTSSGSSFSSGTRTASGFGGTKRR